MNGERIGGGEEEAERMEVIREKLVYMWGYLPGALPQRSPLISPVAVRVPAETFGGDSWKDVCGGGCGFAMAISGAFSYLFLTIFCLKLNLIYFCIFFKVGVVYCDVYGRWCCLLLCLCKLRVFDFMGL